jgi:predicted TPR repeat methyltransferase
MPVRGLMQNPALNPAIQLIQTTNGYIAYDATTDKLHELNPTASLLVELCDGSRSVEEICTFVAPMLPEGSAEGVAQWIEEGVAAGLVVLGGDSGSAHRELSAEELHKISRRLRYRDKEEIALLCQQQATALTPNDPDMWYDLGEMSEMVGRRDEARAAYEKYMEFAPDDAEVRHILVALRGETPPPRMPNDALEQMYAEFSRTFEANLVGELGYKAPEQVRELIDPLLGEREGLAVLDLGCGTGLAGVQFKPRAARLVGVDISPEMIELARARNLYDRLDVAEITGWLARCPERFELVLACDCLIYFGDLRQVLLPVAGLMCTKGLFAFTLERGDIYPIRLADSGRYTHHVNHVREAAEAAKLSVVRLEEAFLRTEYGTPLTGLFVILEKAGTS